MAGRHNGVSKRETSRLGSKEVNEVIFTKSDLQQVTTGFRIGYLKLIFEFGTKVCQLL